MCIVQRIPAVLSRSTNPLQDLQECPVIIRNLHYTRALFPSIVNPRTHSTRRKHNPQIYRLAHIHSTPRTTITRNTHNTIKPKSGRCSERICPGRTTSTTCSRQGYHKKNNIIVWHSARAEGLREKRRARRRAQQTLHPQDRARANQLQQHVQERAAKIAELQMGREIDTTRRRRQSILEAHRNMTSHRSTYQPLQSKQRIKYTAEDSFGICETDGDPVHSQRNGRRQHRLGNQGRKRSKPTPERKHPNTHTTSNVRRTPRHNKNLPKEEIPWNRQNHQPSNNTFPKKISSSTPQHHKQLESSRTLRKSSWRRRFFRTRYYHQCQDVIR